MRKFIVPSLGALALVVGATGGCADFGTTGSAGPPPLVTSAPAVAPPLTVSRIVDGDTVDLSDGRRVRVLGVDAPEQGECGYLEASQFARTTLLGNEVEVTTDPTQDAVDQYGRSLLYIGAPDDYSIAVTRAGWAQHYVVDDNPVQRSAEIAAGQQAAEAAGLGIWGATCAPPASTTARPAPPPPTRPAPPPTKDAPADAGLTPPPDSPAPAPEPKPEPKPAPEPESKPSGRSCHPSYEPCVPRSSRDLDCKDIGHRVTVVGPDEYRLDRDDDGKGCESY